MTAISAVLTAASLHESQVAVPLMKMTSERIDYLYDVMDSAYDAKPIYEVSRSLGHVPIIEKNGRRKEVIPLAPHEARRYQERTAAERFNSRLKEGFGAGNVIGELRKSGFISCLASWPCSPTSCSS